MRSWQVDQAAPTPHMACRRRHRPRFMPTKTNLMCALAVVSNGVQCKLFLSSRLVAIKVQITASPKAQFYFRSENFCLPK
jgi:hypothetical protein